MRESWFVRKLSAKARLKLNLLAASRRITVAKLLEELADQAWKDDDSEVDARSVRKIKRIIARYENSAKELLD